MEGMKRSCLGMVMANVIARGRFYIVQNEVKKGMKEKTMMANLITRKEKDNCKFLGIVKRIK